jgi:hypothetical protein
LDSRRKRMAGARDERQTMIPDERLTVSLKTLAHQLDAHRSSVRRWLSEAGVHPIVLGRGRNAGLRYRWRDIERWLETRHQTSYRVPGWHACAEHSCTGRPSGL